MDDSALPLWQWFVVIGLILSTAEMFVPGFFILPLGLGFLLAAVFAFLIESPLIVYSILAGCLALAAYISVRIYKSTKAKPGYQSGTDRIVGQRLTLMQGILPPNPGQIKVSGDVFFAVSEDGAAIAAGTEVLVKRFEGNRAVVTVAVPTI